MRRHTFQHYEKRLSRQRVIKWREIIEHTSLWFGQSSFWHSTPQYRGRRQNPGQSMFKVNDWLNIWNPISETLYRMMPSTIPFCRPDMTVIGLPFKYKSKVEYQALFKRNRISERANHYQNAIQLPSHTPENSTEEMKENLFIFSRSSCSPQITNYTLRDFHQSLVGQGAWNREFARNWDTYLLRLRLLAGSLMRLTAKTHAERG